MILGNPHPQLTVRSYSTTEQAVHMLNEYLAGMDLEMAL
jgi:hypothetical protein